MLIGAKVLGVHKVGHSSSQVQAVVLGRECRRSSEENAPVPTLQLVAYRYQGMSAQKEHGVRP